MKKSLIWLMVVVVVASMTLVGIGCKATTAEATTAETTTAETTAAETTAAETTVEAAKKIVFVTPCFNFSPDWNVTHKTFMDESRKKGVIGTVVGPNEINAEIMLQNIELAISEKVNGIATYVLDVAQFSPIYDKAKSAGIPIIEVCSNSGHDAVINAMYTDPVGLGKLAAKMISEKAGSEKANVLILYTGPEASEQETAVKAFTDAAKTYPNINIADKQFDKSQIELATNLTVGSLTANPDINYIWCMEGSAPQGASVALQQLDKVGKVNILGKDMQPKTVEDMDKGIIWTSFEQKFSAWGTLVVDNFVDYWDGKEVPRTVDTGVAVWTKDNLKEYYATH